MANLAWIVSLIEGKRDKTYCYFYPFEADEPYADYDGGAA
jgi:hypothetical protein